MQIRRVMGDSIPSNVIEGPTVVLIADNARQESITYEDIVSEQYVYTEYVLTHGEYELLKEGKLNVVWNDTLHRIFRTAQHRKTDDAYMMIQRMERIGALDEYWIAYRDALDAWNSEVSNTANNYATLVSPIPQPPK